MIRGETKRGQEKGHLPLLLILVLIGLAGFLFQLSGLHPERAWQTYLINFLLWSAVAQGGLAFSIVTHLTKARWSKPVQGLSESFAAFFPFSFGLFLVLFLGREHVFPWLHHAHGKEAWLNLPFLFSRDAVGLLTLYGLGLFYLSTALGLKQLQAGPWQANPSLLRRRWSRAGKDEGWYNRRLDRLGVLYLMAYAVVLTLLAFDLVMSMDPHWLSTLFGAYAFVKAFYMGLGGLIIIASLAHLRYGGASGLDASHFHDLGKLFFGFCLLWADFFYCQFIVIWYGNIPEETTYIIQRTMAAPWNGLAWTVFIVSFVIPFVVLLNKQVKTKPRFMIGLCSLVLVGIWLEHLLLVGPAIYPEAAAIPLGVTDFLISLGFLGLMAISVRFALRAFPELIPVKGREAT
jgi:hypothetical protein